MNAKLVVWSSSIIAGVLIALVGLGIVAQPYTFRGSVIEPPAPATDFVLTDQHNQPFRLSDQRGKVVMIFFGYTHCPDVCPTSLADFKQIHTLLGAQAEKVRFVFITVDPERDTPERLREYIPAFHPSFTGLSGDSAKLERVWDSFGVYHEKQSVGSAAGYLVDHTSRVYVVDAHGNLRLTFAFGTDVTDMVEDIRHLAEEAV